MLTTDFGNKVFIITGAARGIGLATAQVLAANGARVVAAVRNPTDVAATQSALGEQALATACDITDYTQVATLIVTTLQQYGQIDGLINNAGAITPIGPLHEADPVAWAANLTANLTGAFYCCHAALPYLLAQGTSVIINLSSGAASRPLEGWSAYCTAKAGLAMLTRSLALEVGAQGVFVYGVRPGLVDTGMQATIRSSGINEVSRIPQTQLASPNLPAACIAWLCSAMPADLAGQEIDIRDETLRARAGI